MTAKTKASPVRMTVHQAAAAMRLPVKTLQQRLYRAVARGEWGSDGPSDRVSSVWFLPLASWQQISDTCHGKGTRKRKA